MKKVSTLMLVALTLLLAASAWAQSAPEPVPVQGKVVRVDQVERIVVLEDGRMFRIIETTEMVVDEKPATIMALQPGTQVIIRNGQVVTAAPGTVIVQPSAAPAAIIAVGPPDPWCRGAWDTTRGTNFGPCPGAKAAP